MFRNLKVSVRLFLMIGVFMFFMVVLSVISLTQLNRVTTEYDFIRTNSVPSVSEISKLRGAINRVVIYEKRHILNNEGGDLTEIEQVLKDKKAEANALLADYEQNMLSPGEEAVFASVETTWARYLTIHEQVLELSRARRTEEAIALSGGEAMTVFNELAGNVEALVVKNMDLSETAGAEAQDTAKQASSYMIIIPIVATLIALVAGLFIAQSITQPISQLGSVADAIASGNLAQRADENDSEVGALGKTFNVMAKTLSQRIEAEQDQRMHLQTTVEQYVASLNQISRGNLAVRVALNGGGSQDPLTLLGRNLNDMTANLAGMIAQIRDAASDLNSASAEILAATTQQVSGASEQSAAIAQTTTTVDEVKTIAEQSSQRAREVTGSSQRTVEVSQAGLLAVKDTIESMAQIKERVEGIAENILALSEQTQQIGEIISTVNDIASQSNMLALNASVEAARAGEHGKGFAVVASEVRSLAEQSRQATAQVKAILSDIQKATNATVMATEEGTKGVDHGVKLAAQAQESIQQLSSVINESSQSAMQMAAGGQQQVSGIDQVALAMQNINQATVQSLASTRQTERAAQNLNDLAKRMSEIVAQYQL